MIPRPHHKQYWTMIELQQYMCRPRLNILSIARKIVNGKPYLFVQHHYYKKMLMFL